MLSNLSPMGTSLAVGSTDVRHTFAPLKFGGCWLNVYLFRNRLDKWAINPPRVHLTFAPKNIPRVTYPGAFGQ